MKRHTLLVALLFFIGVLSAFAQLPNRATIKGTIRDTTGNAAAFATVMLLNPGDSTLVNYTQSTVDGAFTFNNVKNSDYLLKVSHISFLPLQTYVKASEKEINDLGIVIIKPILAELMEVVIRTAKAPLMIKGDTIEYDATMFKVPPGSTVEDLLKRLPGIEVDANGNIKTQGKDVKRVYVDGKSFFGDDPKNATKNLDAEAISKVQVYDEKSEQTQLTGVDDGTKEKAMNLQLKEAYKKGSFGKITLAGGTEERWAGRGNYNRFNESNQLSFIGYANNINETGVNWEDYSEFKGQTAFDDYDNGDFGFKTGGNRYYTFENGDVPLNNFDGRGFTKNAGAGINYNYDDKKTKFNVNYFFHYSRLNYTTSSFTETFLPDSSFFNYDTSDYQTGRGAHSASARIKHEIDSNNTIVAKVNFRYNYGNVDQMDGDWYTDDNANLTNYVLSGLEGDDNSWLVNSAFIYNHKFKKRGRAFAVSVGYNRSKGEDGKTTNASNYFFDSTSYSTLIHQYVDKNNIKEQYKGGLLYSEPLSKIFFLETFYNFSLTNTRENRQTTDPTLGNERIDSLSAYYSNQSLANRLGLGFRFAKNGLNIMLGVAGQYLGLDGKYSVDKGEPLLADPINKIYTNLSPKLDLSYQFKNGMWWQLDYGYGLNEPQFSDLLPVTLITSPTYRWTGNPNLKPERSHSASTNLYYHNPSSYASVNLGIDYSYTTNQIAYNRRLEWVDSVGYVTSVKPDNSSSGQRGSLWVWSDIPLVKTKLSLNLYVYGSLDKSGAYVNDVLNETMNPQAYGSLGFKITPGQKFIMDIGGSINYREVQYSINKSQNQIIYNWSGELGIKWQFLKKSFFESNFDYTSYNNQSYGFNKSLPILNASVRQLFGKKNQFQVRLAAFDIFNKTIDITEYGSLNYVTRSVSPTLARYFMLSVSYNLKGFESKLKKDRYW
jgi:hypothetical protein